MNKTTYLTIKENGLTNNYIMAKRGAGCWPTIKLLPCDAIPEGCDHFVIGKDYAVGQRYLLEERSHEEKTTAIRAVLKAPPTSMATISSLRLCWQTCPRSLMVPCQSSSCA